MRSFWYDNPGHSGFNSRRNPSFGISANGAGQSSGLEHQTRGAYRRIPALSPRPSPPHRPSAALLLLPITGQFPTNSREGSHAWNRSKIQLIRDPGLDHDRTVAALAVLEGSRSRLSTIRFPDRECQRSAPLGENRREDRRSCRLASETDLGPNWNSGYSSADGEYLA